MITVAFSVLLLAAEAASGTTSAQAPAEVSQPAVTPKEERKICKREQSTESRLGSKRVCLTAAQWKARRDQASSLDR